MECSTAEAAELIVVKTGPELLALVTDNAFADQMTGVQLTEYSKRMFPQMKVILLWGTHLPYIPLDTTFFRKPCEVRDLLNAVLN